MRDFLTAMSISLIVFGVILLALSFFAEKNPYFIDAECFNRKGELVFKQKVHTFSLKAESPEKSAFFKCVVTDVP